MCSYRHPCSFSCQGLILIARLQTLSPPVRFEPYPLRHRMQEFLDSPFRPTCRPRQTVPGSRSACFMVIAAFVNATDCARARLLLNSIAPSALARRVVSRAASFGLGPPVQGPARLGGRPPPPQRLIGGGHADQKKRGGRIIASPRVNRHYDPLAQILTVSVTHRDPRRSNTECESETELRGNRNAIPLAVKML